MNKKIILIIILSIIFLFFFFKLVVREYVIDYVYVADKRFQPELTNKEIYFVCKICDIKKNDFVVFKDKEKQNIGKIDKIDKNFLYFSIPSNLQIRKELLIGRFVR